MAIVDELKKLIINRGGQTGGIYNIQDAVAVLNKLEENVENPLKGLTIDTDIAADTDLLGKVIGDLQKDDVVVDAYRGEITGTLKYVTGYTGFSGLESEQQGNYVAVHASVPGVTGVTIKAKLNIESTLDSDGILIGMVKDAQHQKLTFTASKEGYPSVVKTFSLSKLVCEQATT